MLGGRFHLKLLVQLIFVFPPYKAHFVSKLLMWLDLINY